MDTFVDISLYLTYALFFAGLILAIGAPIANMIQNPSAAKGSLIGVIGIGVIFLIGYLLASGEVKPAYEAFGITTETGSKLVGASLISMYILIIIAFVAIIWDSVSKFLK